MQLSTVMHRVLIGSAWVVAASATMPVISTLRGNFHAEVPKARASGALRPLDGHGNAVTLGLDSSTALVLIYSPTCSACIANTDNWLRLGGELRAAHPDIPILLVAAPKDSLSRPLLPVELRSAFKEYSFDSGGVESALGVRILPATVVLRGGRIGTVVYGVVGPRRRARIVRAFAGLSM